MKITANTLSPSHVAGRALQVFFILFLQQLYEVGFLGTPLFLKSRKGSSNVSTGTWSKLEG